jgi:hypothetical protein
LQFIPFQAEIGGAEGHVLSHGGHEELVVRVLEHQSHPPSDLEQVVIGQLQIADPDHPPVGAEEPVDL